MSCSAQDTCESATVKVLRMWACVGAREEIQQACFEPGDPGWNGHMENIRNLYIGLDKCLAVQMDKCSQ